MAYGLTLCGKRPRWATVKRQVSDAPQSDLCQPCERHHAKGTRGVYRRR